MTSRHHARCLLIAAAFCGFALAFSPAAAETVRIGVLKFGTVAWELDVIKAHGLDEAEGIDVEVVGLAGKDATSVALQAGKVDMIVTDWIWVSRQRAAGAGFTFVPYSTAVGALMVPPDSPIRTLPDLKGKRLGIAGGPADKSWLLIRALARERHGMDLAAEADAVFGTPPLLNEQILLGRTIWRNSRPKASEPWSALRRRRENSASARTCRCSATSSMKAGARRIVTASRPSFAPAARQSGFSSSPTPNGSGSVR